MRYHTVATARSEHFGVVVESHTLHVYMQCDVCHETVITDTRAITGSMDGFDPYQQFSWDPSSRELDTYHSLFLRSAKAVTRKSQVCHWCNSDFYGVERAVKALLFKRHQATFT